MGDEELENMEVVVLDVKCGEEERYKKVRRGEVEGSF